VQSLVFEIRVVMCKQMSLSRQSKIQKRIVNKLFVQ